MPGTSRRTGGIPERIRSRAGTASTQRPIVSAGCLASLAAHLERGLPAGHLHEPEIARGFKGPAGFERNSCIAVRTDPAVCPTASRRFGCPGNAEGSIRARRCLAGEVGVGEDPSEGSGLRILPARGRGMAWRTGTGTPGPPRSGWRPAAARYKWLILSGEPGGTRTRDHLIKSSHNQHQCNSLAIASIRF